MDEWTGLLTGGTPAGKDAEVMQNTARAPSDQRHFALFRNNFLPVSETFIHDELRHHRRYRATVFARRLMNADRFPGHDVVSLDQGPFGARSPLSLGYLATALHPRFFSALHDQDFQLIHTHFGHNTPYSFPYVKASKLPWIVSLHGADVTMLLGTERFNPRWWYYTLIARRLFQHVDRFLAASTELAELAIQAGCRRDRIVVHRLGIDLTRFRPRQERLAFDGKAPLVLMVGRFVEKKGFDFGIRAFAKVARGSAVRMVLVGTGPLASRYRDLVSSLGLTDRVQFTGALPPEGVARLMSQAQVVMTPSVVASNFDRESGIIVAKEACASGVPVVGTWHGGLPEIVESGRTGYLVPERNVDGLSQALSDLLAHPDRAFEMGRAARAKMEREYDIRERNEVLERIYDDVIVGH
ncbi:MAG: glycosyltransferase [Deltaproteobacteria bacterium]|nr:glycosyltransferase [Deltaproteobacteria bacterium]